MATNYNKITDKEFNSVYLRQAFIPMTTWSYQNMMGPSSAVVMNKALHRIYENHEDQYRETLHAHFNLYNSNPHLAMMIFGIMLSLENNVTEETYEETREAVAAIKSSLMGPFAGVGDSIFTVIPTTVLAGLAAYMAVQGNPVGLLFLILYSAALFVITRFLYVTSYKKGTEFVSSLSGQLDNFINSANMLGLMVVGAMIPTSIWASFALEFKVGESVTSLQTLLNNILPASTQVLLVALAYWLLGKKNMTAAKLVFIIIAIAIVGNLLGILA